MIEFKKPTDQINSVIGEGTVVKGEIRSAGHLYIGGSVEGVINIEGDIIVSEKAKVIGDVDGARVIVAGLVEGDIVARKGLEINKTGRVKGEITCDKLMIEDGSAYQGKVNVGALPGREDRKEEPPSETYVEMANA